VRAELWFTLSLEGPGSSFLLGKDTGMRLQEVSFAPRYPSLRMLPATRRLFRFLFAYGIFARMKLHPTRNKFAGRSELRGRMMKEIFTSERGQRVLSECQETLDRPANADDYSRQLVMQRFATELDIYEYELEDLLKRLAGADPEKEKNPA
jgi:hypothetical protein